MNKKIGKIVFILIMFALILVGMSTIIKAEDASFSLSNTEKEVWLNSTGSLSYNNKPDGETVIWTSSNTNVATVDNYGTVAGISIGETTITATAGTQTATCKISVVYYDLKVEDNSGYSVTKLNLVLGEHPTETLKTTVEDGKSNVINDANITWTSSDPSTVTVDNNGKVTGIKEGKANVNVAVAGISKTIEVNVIAAPVFTDFSKAKYELLFDISTDLKISGITPDNNSSNCYYYIITPNDTKPNVSFSKHGGVDNEASKNAKYLRINEKEKYIYATGLDAYVELNQDLYLWVIQEVKLGDSYYDNQENNVYRTAKFVVEGKKLNRPQLPQLNLILKGFNVGSWDNKAGTDTATWIKFRYPSATENRKFKIKIGKITDNAILQKIQKGDYSGITDLLAYAKKSSAVYTSDLVTNSKAYYKSEKALFDGRKLLENKAYYYIYVQFDNENGKYYPIEGVTLGQAYISDYNSNWNIWAYTSEDFKWNDLSSTPSTSEKDKTIANTKLPNTGANILIAISTITLVTLTVVLKVKKDKYKEI